MSALPELIERALNQAYALGQKYWMQADSESYSQNRKADETDARFKQLRVETLAALPHLRGQGVPCERQPVGGPNYGWLGEYNRGWNDCRAAVLAVSKPAEGGEHKCDYRRGAGVAPYCMHCGALESVGGEDEHV